MEQQGVMQDAVLMSQRNLAEADQNTKFGIQNAQAFLSMDLQNLNNQQQANVLKAQQIQQSLLLGVKSMTCQAIVVAEVTCDG